MKRNKKSMFIISLLIISAGILVAGIFTLSRDIQPNLVPIEKEISLENFDSNV